MKMLHNFLNFLPFIILQHFGKERKEGKKLRHHHEGKNFHLLRALSHGKCFSSTIDVKKKMWVREERRNGKSCCAHVKNEKEGKGKLDWVFRQRFSAFFSLKSMIANLCACGRCITSKWWRHRCMERKMMKTLTYGFEPTGSVIYGTDAFRINFLSEKPKHLFTCSRWWC